MRKEFCTLVALVLSLSGCGKHEAPGSNAVNPFGAAPTRPGEGKDPLAGLATREGATLEGPNSKVYAVAFSPDGKTLASGLYQKILLWDLGMGKQSGVLEGEGGQVTGLAFSPDGKVLASSGEDRKIRFWDVAGKQVKGTVENLGLIGLVTMLSFTPDGNTVFVNAGDNEGGGYGWDVATRKKQPALVGLRRQPLRNEARSYIHYAFSPGGKCVGASGVAPGEMFATVVEVPSRKQLVDIPQFAGVLASVSCTAKTILCKEDKTDKLSLWDFSGKKRADLEGKDLATIGAFSHDGKYLAASMQDKQFKGVLQVWDVATARLLVTLNDEAEFLSVAFAKDGEFLAAGAAYGRTKVWKVNAVVK